MSYIHCHRNQGEVVLPEWARRLQNYYWVIRVEARDKSKVRKYYRLVGREKLRLAEMDIDQDLINAVCRYLCGLTFVSGKRVDELMRSPKRQLTLNFLMESNIKILSSSFNIIYIMRSTRDSEIGWCFEEKAPLLGFASHQIRHASAANGVLCAEVFAHGSN